jgi:RecA/RadA recombinase
LREDIMRAARLSKVGNDSRRETQAFAQVAHFANAGFAFDQNRPRVLRIPTTFAELDALPAGWLPRGKISEVIGPPTSDKLTVAAKVIAALHVL